MVENTRLIKESGQESRLASIVEPIIEGLGMQLVQVRLLDHNGLTLQVMAERLDGTMSVEDCEQLSKAISPVLDIEDPITSNYQLEISSPGVDRPLVRSSDFDTWLGSNVKIETHIKIDGRRRFKGILLGHTTDNIVIRSIEGSDIELSLSSISKAKLLLDENLLSESLRQDKATRKNQMENSHGC